MTQEIEVDITKLIPKEEVKPKPKVYDPFPFDTRQFTIKAIRNHYPDLEHKLIRD